MGMKIIHRISLLAISEDLKQKYASLGIDVNTQVFEMDESDARWPVVSQILQEHKTIHPVYTKFTQQECTEADLLVLWPTWHCGYPMPDNDFGYRNLTYDPHDRCTKCGRGAIQKTPFRMKGEPRWGKNHILQLNWIFDEYFVKPEVWEQVFRPFGIDIVPVVRNKTGQGLETVVQLKIDCIVESDLRSSGLPYEKCEKCHQVKYLPHTRGMFPPFTYMGKGPKPIFKTKEYFGSGGIANREVIVSQQLYAAIAAAKLKGVSFMPVAKT
jgi:hypothetical protein